MKTYTEPLENGMRVKHDAQARITVRAGKEVLQDELIGVESVGGAMTVASITYNALSVSGGVSWWNPATGKPVSRPKISIRLRPEDILTGDMECNCDNCQ
jgi:hypothetical protein